MRLQVYHWQEVWSRGELLQLLAEVNATVDDLETKSLVGALRFFMVDPGVGGHLAAALRASPGFGGTHEGAAHSAMP